MKLGIEYMYLEVLAQIQGDQLYIAVGFWYLVKRDLSSVRYFNSSVC